MANPTTNYGFVLPTSSDLVTDLPADFDVALQGVDTRLKALQPGTTLGDLAYSSATANTNTRLPVGTTGQVLTVAGGVPTWSTPSSGMTNPMTTTGDTIYSSSGSTPARLPIGTTGQVLSVSGGIPAWTAPPAGKIIQVVQGRTNAGASSTSGAFVDTNLTATITPTSASNSILVMVSQNGVGSTSNDTVIYRLIRNSTVIVEPFGNVKGASVPNIASVGINWIDSPGTTSAVTYKTDMVRLSGSGGYSAQQGNAWSSMTLIEIGA